MGQCNSCNKPIQWVKTPNGRIMPLDPEPVQYGGNIVIRNGVAIVLLKGEPAEAGEKIYRSHFATCSSSRQHRKGKK